jgi:hypothetical protein
MLSVQRRGTHLELELRWPNSPHVFSVNFWVRSTGDAKQPVVLLNTHVKDRHGSAKDIYSAVLGIFCEIFPPHTPLVTYVRQEDSLAMLEAWETDDRSADASALYRCSNAADGSSLRSQKRVAYTVNGVTLFVSQRVNLWQLPGIFYADLLHYFYRCANLRPVEDDFRFGDAHVYTTMAHRMAKVVMPVC